MAPDVDLNREKAYLLTPTILIIQGIFTAHLTARMTKTDLTFTALCMRFADFEAEFCFRCKFSVYEKRQLSQRRDFPEPIQN